MTDLRTEALEAKLREAPRTWLVTGAAGFIGSHLAERLLRLGQRVRGFDNLSTGFLANVEAVRVAVGPESAARYEFVQADVQDRAAIGRACEGVDVVLHEAALGSVPRSMENPLATFGSNVTGTAHVLEAARAAAVKRVVFASSSSVYGDHPALPKREEHLGVPLSPYAASKRAAELLLQSWHRAYGLPTVGLRYFNVFGPRQNPNGAYAAVIPRWISTLLQGEQVELHGDGSTSRDFSYVENVVLANLRAATVEDPAALGQLFNVACGARTTLAELYVAIRAEVARHRPDVAGLEPRRVPNRPGDVPHSLADVSRAAALLGYEPTVTLPQGLGPTVAGFLAGASR